MVAPDPLFYACLAGAALAGAIHFLLALRLGVWPDLIHFFEAILFGVAFGCAVDLMAGGIWPEHLVEVLGKDGRTLHPPDARLSLDTFHRIEIVLGGFFLVCLACRGFYGVLPRRHRHANHRHPPTPTTEEPRAQV